MAEFRLERFKYTWKGEWTSGVAYKRDDVVRVNGKSYVCILGHVSNTTFKEDLTAILPGSNPPQPQPRWVVMTSGRSFEGNWTTGTEYNLGDIVSYDGSLWTCIVSHNASNFATDFDNWTVFAQTTNFVGNWTNNTTYAPGAVVKYNGITYKCLTAHTSGSTLESSLTDSTSAWVVYHLGVEIRNDWQSNTEYRVNDFVKYGGTVYRCIETHTSNSTNLDESKFTVEVFGSQYDGDWNSTTYYNIGDIVRHRGFMYYATKNNIDSKPFIDSDAGSQDWILLARNYNFIGNWNIDTEYKTGDIVLRGGNLYLALRDVSTDNQDGSTIDYLDDSTWELLIPGKSFKGNWTSGIEYLIGDVIYYRNSAYTCNFQHTASIQNFPGDNGNVEDYWDLLIAGGELGGLEQKGDLLTYGPNRFIDQSGSYLEDGSTVFDDSSFGNTRVPIGEAEQILSISSELEVYWRSIQEDADSIFVSSNGVDDNDDNRGTFQKPFRTIRYAAEYVEDNYTPGQPVIIRVSTGKFEEIGPIVVPAGCAINGDELRSTTVIANPPLAAYQNDYQYMTAIIDHFRSILADIVLGEEVTPQEGNSQIQQFNFPQFDSDGNPIINPVTGEPGNSFPISNLTAANNIFNLTEDFKNHIEFYISSGNVSVSLTGSNILRSNDIERNSAEALRLNRSFIEQDLLNYLRNTYPDIVFDEQKVKNDVWSLLRGIIRDMTYTGNYGTLTAARRYANAVTGSQTTDLFYMRDSTGLRDMTTGGLQGVLNPPGVFELYQKPTGGALVSLDPGWGPDDQRTWITNRSPYIQGVTNTGTGCIGMKVDGALHTNGNKSMTANDFTQVLSDGIGAWITNNARAELVSVFTYYCQIGYFAEDGGIIRSANGNNSYGRYGSIADGIDDTETPQVVQVFNRNNEAQVSEAFAGGTNDELKILEYSNAGEEYTTASATITGSGSNASVEFTDFRDGGIFEERLISPDGSSNAGGGGYLRRQGSAQETLDASSTLKLASTDTTQFESEILGMRIIITDGVGVGQYGYIDGFTFATKEVTVRRESDETLGWDHIIPGTPLVNAFDLTTRYRIEPRVTVSEPPYSTSSATLFTNRTYVDMAFGNITETYTGVTAGGNVIWRDESETRITVNSIISDIAIQFNATFGANPRVPFNIKGRTSGAESTVTAITANTSEIIEVDITSGGSNFLVGEEIDLTLTSGTGNIFDGVATPAELTVVREGTEYNVTFTNIGAGYAVGDKITIPGTSLGGTSPANDLIITVTEVTDDSTSSIVNFTQAGTGRGGRFVSLTNIENARYSDNGTDWTEVTLPFSTTMTSLAAGNNRFIATASGEARVASSLNGILWTEVALPLEAAWIDSVYGNGKFVIIANDDDRVAVSSDGIIWDTSNSIPNDTDGGGDSTTSLWGSITYGKGIYLAVSYSDLATATSTDGITWTRHDSALPNSGNATWFNVAYGNNRFVAVTTDGVVAYSFDGIIWYESATLSAIELGFEPNTSNALKYNNGIFMVLGGSAGPKTSVLTSEDGLLWTQRVLPSTKNWSALTYGNGNWYIKASAASTDAVAIISVGARAKLRTEIDVGSIDEIRVLDPGSGYDPLNLPTVAITDPNVIFEAATETRIGNGVLAQPDFVNRGSGYRRSTSAITISGDGFADIVPVGNILTVSGIVNIPGPGVQIQIAGIEDPDALVPGTLANFSGVTITDLGDDGTGNETNLVRFQISPRLDVEFVVPHATEVTLRERFSQCRISGHDFLDIGTGNFEQTNYPDIYSGGAFFTASPENEVYEANSGRVFYVSTDQDGNFRTGELFSVQQATGIVTISAEFFDLDGLSELALGGVRLGGSGAVVNEFSTDPTFAADSNNVVPTQRAIASFLADRLSVGGESLQVNKLQAGRVLIGGTPENELNTNTGQYIIIPSDVVFDGTFETNDGEGNITTEQTNISGTIISQMLYFKGFDDSMQ